MEKGLQQIRADCNYALDAKSDRIDPWILTQAGSGRGRNQFNRDKAAGGE